MANQLPKEEDQDESVGSSNRSKGKLLIEYTLRPLVDATVFSVQKIGSEVMDFLKKVGTFEAENGIRIKIGYAYNEWKESQNIIYLNDKVMDRPDITRFPTNGKRIRDNKNAMFNSAIKDLVDTVKANYRGPIVESQLNDDGKIRLS